MSSRVTGRKGGPKVDREVSLNQVREVRGLTLVGRTSSAFICKGVEYPQTFSKLNLQQLARLLDTRSIELKWFPSVGTSLQAPLGFGEVLLPEAEPCSPDHTAGPARHTASDW